MSIASNIHIQNRPPRVSGTDPEDAVYSASTSAAAASADLWTNYTADPSGNKTPPGKVFIEVEAVTTTAFIRFSRTNSTATTSSTGAAVTPGTPRVFCVDPTKDLFIDHIATGAGILKWRRVGPILERSRA